MFARLRYGGNLPLCLAFGTGEGHLWYGICVPCSKRLPGVRDAFTEAFGVKNRLLRYGRDIRCQKQPPLVRDASSKARRTADSTDCGQPTAAPDTSSVRETVVSQKWKQKSPLKNSGPNVVLAGVEPATHGFSVHCSTT